MVHVTCGFCCDCSARMKRQDMFERYKYGHSWNRSNILEFQGSSSDFLGRGSIPNSIYARMIIIIYSSSSLWRFFADMINLHITLAGTVQSCRNTGLLTFHSITEANMGHKARQFSLQQGHF